MSTQALALRSSSHTEGSTLASSHPEYLNISISNIKLRFWKQPKKQRPKQPQTNDPWPGKNLIVSRMPCYFSEQIPAFSPGSYFTMESPSSWRCFSSEAELNISCYSCGKTLCICRVQGPCSYWTHGWVVYQFGFILMKDGAHVRNLVSYCIWEG